MLNRSRTWPASVITAHATDLQTENNTSNNTLILFDAVKNLHKHDLPSRGSTCTTCILSSDCFPVQPCTMPFPFRQLVVFCIQNWGRGSWTGVSLCQRSRSTVKGLNLDNMHFIQWLFFCTTTHNALSIQAVSWGCSAFRTEAEVAGQESLSMPKVPSITTVLKWLAHGLNLVHGPPCATSTLLTLSWNSLPFCPDHCH